PICPDHPGPIGYPLPRLTLGSPTAPDLMPEGSKACTCTSHRAASAASMHRRLAAERVVKYGSPLGTSATIFSSPETSSFSVRRSATWKKGVSGWNRSNLDRTRWAYARICSSVSSSASHSCSHSPLSCGPSIARCRKASSSRVIANAWVGTSPAIVPSCWACSNAPRIETCRSRPSGSSTTIHGSSRRLNPTSADIANPFALGECSALECQLTGIRKPWRNSAVTAEHFQTRLRCVANPLVTDLPPAVLVDEENRQAVDERRLFP